MQGKCCFKNDFRAGFPVLLIDKRKKEQLYPPEMEPRNEMISDEAVVWCWKNFEQKHQA